MEENKKELKVSAFQGSADMKRKATRQEVVEITQQILENISIISNGLMEDLNILYSQQVFPFQMTLWAIEQLLIEKGILTKEEIDAKVEERKQDLLSRAKEIKDRGNGLEAVSKEEEFKDEYKLAKDAVQKARGEKKRGRSKKVKSEEIKSE
jgi:hypothetical protein